MAQHDIASHDGAHLRFVQRVHNGGRHAGTHGHGKKGGVHAMAIGQTETDIGRAASGVDL